MKGLKGLLALLFCALFLLVLPATADVPVPALTKRVTDLTGTLSASQVSKLEESLASFERARGSQIAVLMIETTQPEAIEQYSMRVVEQWKLGRGKFDDGVLFLVAKGDRRMRIEVGYGLEGAIPDIKAKRIISDIVTPRFKQRDFYGGILGGIDALQKLISGENLPAPQTGQPYSGGHSSDTVMPLVLMVGLFATAIAGSLSKLVGKIPAGFVGGTLVFLIVAFSGAVLAAVLAAVFVFILVAFSKAADSMASSSFGTGSTWRSSRSGSSWSSRSSGGFSGGGGSFGGGGASWSW